MPARLLFRPAAACLAALLVATPPARAAEAPPAAGVPDPATLLPAVSVVPAERREIVERAVVTGTLVPRDEILVAPEVEGLRIVALLVEEGDRVERGAVLARLSLEMIETQEAANLAATAKAEAAILQAKSQIVQVQAAQTEARQALERAQALVRTGNATAVTLEQRVSAAQGADGRLGPGWRWPRRIWPRRGRRGARSACAGPAPRSARRRPGSSAAARPGSAPPRARSASRCSA